MRKQRVDERKAGGAGLGRRPRHGLPGKIQLTVSQEEKLDIENAASVLGISVSRFAARAALRDTELVLAGAHTRASATGLRPTHERILKLVGSADQKTPATMGSIWRKLEIRPAVLSREVGQMEKLDLVKRRRIAGHREVFVHLTPNGQRIWQRTQSLL